MPASDTPSLSAPQSPRKTIARTRMLDFLIILVCAAVSHFPVIFNEFTTDDIPLIPAHPLLASPGFIQKIWTRDYGLEFAREPANYYRPCFMAFLILQRHVFGIHPVGYRVVSLLTLVAAAWLIMRLAQKFSGRRSAGLLTGCLYACHPLKTETVAMVSSWPDLFLTLSLCAMIWAGLSAMRSRARWGKTCALLFLVFLLALVSMLTKESAVFYVAAIAAGFAAVAPRKRLRALLAPAMQAAAILLCFTLRSLAVKSTVPLTVILLSPFHRLGASASLWSIAVSLRDFLIPAPFHYARYCGLKVETGGVPSWAPMAQIALVALALGAAALWGWLIWRRRPFYAIFFSWSVTGLYALIIVMMGDTVYASRYVCLAPLCILAALILPRASSGLKRFPSLRTASGNANIASIIAWAMLGLFAAFSLDATTKALNPRTYWKILSEDEPKLFFAHVGLACTLFGEGDMKGMEASARRAIALQPDHPRTRRLGLNLCVKAWRENNPEEARRWVDWAGEILKDSPEVKFYREKALEALSQKKSPFQ
ncbi:MAG: hypothetical protein NTX50_13930 [Candidatus Sumerlaeota bacterium]|nr:hypothetical protein [Candidatus Sumerlaeota bacterium]